MKLKARIKITPNKKLLKGLDDALKKQNDILFQTGEYTRRTMLKNWNNSKGASGDPLKALSEDYKEKKTTGIKVNGATRTGEGKPDFLLTGDLQRATFTNKVPKNIVEVTVRGKEKLKAIGNAARRPNMFDVDEAFAAKIRNVFRRRLLKHLKD